MLKNRQAHLIVAIALGTIACLDSFNCRAQASAAVQDELTVSAPADPKPSSTSSAEIDSRFRAPDWFENQVVSNQDGIFLYIQTNQPCSNPLQAEQALDQDCRAAIRRVIDQWYRAGAGAKVNVDPSYIKAQLAVDGRMLVKQYKDEHTEELCRNFGKDYEYFRGYAQLQLTDDFREYVQQRWKIEQTRTRLMHSGIVGVSVLGLLLIMLGYFRLEQATRGFYSLRLQMIGAIVILALVASAVWILRTLEIF